MTLTLPSFPALSGMQTILAVLFILIALSFWHAQRRKDFDFNAFDLIMENGKVSKIGVAFMMVLGVTTWLIIDLQITGKLTEGYLGIYGTMWVTPLVARVVFNKTSPHTEEPK